MENKTLNQISLIAFHLFLYLFLSFFYSGFTTVPSEGDSLAYHIPIAESILDGSVFNPSRDGYALGFYPGSAEIILSLFMLLHLPLNLYNVLGWVVLAFLSYYLARSYKKEHSLAVIYAVSVVTVISMIRLLNNQTIDIWLAVFFTWSFLLLKTPQKTLHYFLQLGIAVGLLIGSKYSGPLYAGVLFLFFGRELIRYITPLRSVVFLLPLTLFGLSWYIRNLYLTGNPLYPQPILFLPGNPEFHLMEWVGWKTILFYPNGLGLMFFALFQEYLLWSLLPVMGVYGLIKSRVIRDKRKERRALIAIGMLNFLIFFFLPSTGNNIITYLRYMFPAFIPLILVFFLLMEKHKKAGFILPLFLMQPFLAITMTPHRPKLMLLFFIIAALFLYQYARIEERREEK
jgi:hypothetical protein